MQSSSRPAPLSKRSPSPLHRSHTDKHQLPTPISLIPSDSRTFPLKTNTDPVKTESEDRPDVWQPQIFPIANELLAALHSPGKRPMPVDETTLAEMSGLLSPQPLALMLADPALPVHSSIGPLPSPMKVPKPFHTLERSPSQCLALNTEDSNSLSPGRGDFLDLDGFSTQGGSMGLTGPSVNPGRRSVSMVARLEKEFFESMVSYLPRVTRTVVSSNASPIKNSESRQATAVDLVWPDERSNKQDVKLTRSTLQQQIAQIPMNATRQPATRPPTDLEIMYKDNPAGLNYARELSTSWLIPAPTYPPNSKIIEAPIYTAPNTFHPAPQEAQYKQWFCMWHDTLGCRNPVFVARTPCAQCHGQPIINGRMDTAFQRIEALREGQLQSQFAAERAVQAPQPQLPHILKRKPNGENIHAGIVNMARPVGVDQRMMRGDEKRLRSSATMIGGGSAKEAEIKYMRRTDGSVVPVEVEVPLTVKMEKRHVGQLNRSVTPYNSTLEASQMKKTETVVMRHTDGTVIHVKVTLPSGSTERREKRHNRQLDGLILSGNKTLEGSSMKKAGTAYARRSAGSFVPDKSPLRDSPKKKPEIGHVGQLDGCIVPTEVTMEGSSAGKTEKRYIRQLDGSIVPMGRVPGVIPPARVKKGHRRRLQPFDPSEDALGHNPMNKNEGERYLQHLDGSKVPLINLDD